MKITEDEFQNWLAHMDDGLEEFFATLPEEVRDRLDYSIDSLDVIEAWLLERYPRYEDVKRQGEALPLDGAARYIGETYRKTIGGRWWLDPKGKLWGGWLLIVDCRTSGSAICPLSEATASTDRRRGNLISGLLRYELKYLSGQDRPTDLPPPAKRQKARSKKNRKTIEEGWFDYWLSLMDRALAELSAALPESLRPRLDFSPESLDALEAWLLSRYPDGESARAETEVVLLDGVARYVGEIFRKTIGGHWWFDLDGWTHDGLPQLGGLGPHQASVCPLALVREATDTRSKHFLRTVLGSHRLPKAADRGSSAEN